MTTDMKMMEAALIHGMVREENEYFCKKNREICNFLQFREEKEKFENKSHDSRGDRDVEISNFL